MTTNKTFALLHSFAKSSSISSAQVAVARLDGSAVDETGTVIPWRAQGTLGAAIYELRVQSRDVSRLISRCLLVRGSSTMAALHPVGGIDR